jgi:hypothetical protein
MNVKFRAPNRKARFVIGVLAGMAVATLQIGCTPAPAPTSEQSLAPVQIEQAEPQHAVENVSEALGQRLDQMLSSTNRLSQR